MAADPHTPADRENYVSQEHPAEECPDPGTFASKLFEHLAFVHGDADADLYASRVVAELCELSPVVREHVSDLVLVEVVEELHRHGKPGREAARLVAEVQRDWSQEA